MILLLAAAISLPVLAQETNKEAFAFTLPATHQIRTVNVRDFAASLPSNLSSLPVQHKSMRSSQRVTPMNAADSALWINRINNMHDYMVGFYQNYSRLVNDILIGQDNFLSNPAMGEQDGSMSYIPLILWEDQINFSFSPDATQDQILEIATQAYNNVINDFENEFYIFMPYLTMCLSYDNPQAFWIGNHYSYGIIGASPSVYLTSNTTGYVDYSEMGIIVLKSETYDIRINEYIDSFSLRNGITLFNSAVGTILNELPQSSLYDKLLYLNDWLTSHNCYSSALGKGNEPTIIRSPMSALMGNVGDTGPVCEGYARAFKVLCDRLGVTSILITGWGKGKPSDTGEAHMWNEILMDNGKWYAVDVTWDDPVNAFFPDVAVSGSENHKWFLVGRNTIINDMLFHQSHINNIDHQYAVYWDYSCNTYIEKQEYPDPTAVAAFGADAQSASVHDITGRLIGRFPSVQQAERSLSPGMYIINGRKKTIISR